MGRAAAGGHRGRLSGDALAADGELARRTAWMTADVLDCGLGGGAAADQMDGLARTRGALVWPFALRLHLLECLANLTATRHHRASRCSHGSLGWDLEEGSWRQERCPVFRVRRSRVGVALAWGCARITHHGPAGSREKVTKWIIIAYSSRDCLNLDYRVRIAEPWTKTRRGLAEVQVGQTPRTGPSREDAICAGRLHAGCGLPVAPLAHLTCTLGPQQKIYASPKKP